jgi:lysophospholipase L1-like esterase
MAAILCFGDSNTWGFVPGSGGRYARDVRWPGVMAAELGGAHEVIEEALNGRTTVFEDPIMPGRCGIQYLEPSLESHRPLDLVIVMLGTNDSKVRLSATAYDIMRGMKRIVETVQRSGAAKKLLIVAPPLPGKLTEFAEQFAGAEEKLRKLPEYYSKLAREMGCAFFDASAVVRSSDVDGIHWEAGEHRKLGLALAPAVKRLLAD